MSPSLSPVVAAAIIASAPRAHCPWIARRPALHVVDVPL